jgi:hypothetical protein
MYGLKPTISLVTVLLTAFSAAVNGAENHDAGRSEYRAPKSNTAISIDGVADEPVWQNAPWQELNHRWLGPEYSSDDFEGRYKVAWSDNKLYILAVITDDVLEDRHRDPLVQYWDDDCLEIFIDEDFSGGNHQFNHNAFAYHMSLDTNKHAIIPTMLKAAGSNKAIK